MRVLYFTWMDRWRVAYFAMLNRNIILSFVMVFNLKRDYCGNLFLGRLLSLVLNPDLLGGSDKIDEPKSTGSSGNEMGVIRVVIRRCTILSYDATPTFMQFNSQSQVDEKTQKGLLDTKTEYASSEDAADEGRLRAAEPYKAGSYAKVVYKDPGPRAEFSFTYKSLSISIVIYI